MTSPIDFTVIDNLHASASQGQHAHVIQETFAIEMELQNLELHLLDIRARSYVACAQFAKALDTANTMQQINPASALGYLCQGYIHMQQGRYIAATHVYDKALELVNKRDPLYDTIQTAKDVAMQQGESRRDFIRDLPLEISVRIIQQVFTHEEYDRQREYVMVSRAWWDRIMTSNHLEYSMKLQHPLDETSDMVIQSFGHTRALTIMYSRTPLSHLFQEYHFIRLTTLAVYAWRWDFDESLSILRRIGTQLTDLVLYCHDHRADHHQRYVPRLQHILTTCPNLISLYCHTTIDIGCIKETYPKLRELKLYGVAGTVGRWHMMMIREHLPELKTLDMAIQGSSRPLTVDDTCLPCMRHLGYGDPPSTYHEGLDLKRHGQQGLLSLSITHTKDVFSLDDIAPIIIQQHATLHFLELKSRLDTTDTRNTMDVMQGFQHIDFKDLKTLMMNYPALNVDLPTYSNFISWVIARAPYLHTVTLKGATMNHPSLKSLAKCMHLRYVDFDIHNQFRSANYDTLVADFMSDHVNYMADKGGSRLESIKVRLHQAHPALIDSIRELKSLTFFQLFANDLAPEPFMRLFESLRQGCQDLETLLVMNEGTMPNRILFNIGGLPNLRYLTISGNTSDAQAGVLSLQRCRYLTSLTSYWPIDHDIRSMLLESNPHLHISATNI